MWIPGFGKYRPREGNRVGDVAPDFALRDHDGREVRLADELGGLPVALIFYPRASSPVCARCRARCAHSTSFISRFKRSFRTPPTAKGNGIA
jgi:hypothetical protein